MKQKTKNLVSVILPVASLLLIGIVLRQNPTGFAVSGFSQNLSLRLEGKIPLDSVVCISTDERSYNITLHDFISANDCITDSESVVCNGTYAIPLKSLGIDNVDDGRISVALVDDRVILAGEGMHCVG